MWRTFIEFLSRLREDLALNALVKKRVTIRHIRDGGIKECVVGGSHADRGTITVILRPSIVVRKQRPPSRDGQQVATTSIRLDSIVEIEIEQWDQEGGEPIGTLRWVRDRRGRLRLVTGE